MRFRFLAALLLGLPTAVLAQPNYIISDIDVSESSVRPGDDIEIECRVRNTGNQDVGYSTELQYALAYRVNGVFQVVPVGTDGVEPLDAGERSRVERSTETVPANADPGTLLVRCFADSDFEVAESDENDNIGALTIPITQAGPPDLIVEDQNADPIWEIGSQASVEAYVANRGDQSTGTTRLGYYLVGTNNNVDLFLGDDSVSGLSRNDRSRETATFNVPASVPTGSYIVRFRADLNNQEDEGAGENNNDQFAFGVQVVAATPDVEAQSVTVNPTSAGVGDAVDATCRARNLGSSATPSAVRLSLAFFSGGNSTLIGVADTGTLGGGQTVSRTLSGPVPSWATPGSSIGVQCIVLYADDPNTSNNSATTPLTIVEQDGPPVLSAVSPDPAPGVDGNQTLTLQGSRFPSDAVVFLRNVSAGSDATLHYPAQLSATQLQLSVNLSNVSASWSARVASPTTGVSGAVPFSVVASGGGQNAPTVTGVSPNPVLPQSTRQYLVITGSGFTPTSEVVFRDLDYGGGQSFPPVPASRQEYLSSTALRVFAGFDVYAADWTVTVRSGGTASTPFPFSVSGGGSGGGQSGGVAITSLSPSAVQGGTTASITLSGSGFGSAPVVTLLRVGESSPQTVSASGSDTQLTFSRSFPDTEAAYVVSVDADGSSASATLQVVPAGSGGGSTGSVVVGGLTFSGGTVIDESPTRKTLSGGVDVNGALFLTGTVTVDQSALTVSGNGQVYVRSSGGGIELVLYQGGYTFSVNQQLNRLVAGNLNQVNTRLRLAGLPVRIDGLTLVAGGVRVNGELTLPSAFGSSASISSLSITSAGVDLTGAITLPNASLGPQLSLTNTSLSFNTATDSFSGQGQFQTPLVGVSASVSLIQGELDQVSLVIQPSTPIPIGTTGLSMSGGGGGLENLRQGPLVVEFQTSLVPTVQGPVEVIELSNVTLRMTQGEGFRGSGAFRLFNRPLGSAYLALRRSGGEIGGSVNLANILNGDASLGITGNASGLAVQGSLDARLVIPSCGGVLCGLISARVGLPYTVGTVEAVLRNARANAGFVVDPPFFPAIRGGLQMTYTGSTIAVEWGRDYAPGGTLLFPSDITFLDLGTGERLDQDAVVVGPDAMNSGARRTGSGIEQTFEVAEFYRTLILRVRRSDGVTPSPTLTLPGGVVVDAQTQPIGTGFVTDDADTSAFFVLTAPPQGVYLLTSDGPSLEITTAVAAETPSILLNPVAPSGDAFAVSWNDAATSAPLALYYDTDARGVDGALIVDGLAESGANAYTWTPGPDVPTGDYFVYAVVDDGAAPAVSYAPNPVRVVAAGAPTRPTGVQATVTPDGLVARWTPQPDLDHRVYVADRGVPAFTSPAYGATDAARLAVPDVAPGRTYALAVSALSSNGAESALSDPASVLYLSATGNNAPTAATLPALVVASAGQAISIDAAGTDPDDDPLVYSPVLVPPGLVVDTDGELSWTPGPGDRGEHLVRIRVADPAGLADSSDVRIRVLAPDQDTGSVRFGSAVYTGTDSPAMPILSDLRLDLDPAALDLASVTVWSSSDPAPQSVQVRETESSSGLFVGTLPLAVSDDAGLHVAPGDTLYVEYTSTTGPTAQSIARFEPDTYTDASPDAPLVFEVDAPYPNPAVRQVVLGFTIAELSETQIEVVDVLGRVVATLLDRSLTPGSHQVAWDADVAPGAYFMRLRTGASGRIEVVSKRVTVVR